MPRSLTPRDRGPSIRVVGRWRADLADYVNALAWSPDGRWVAAAAVSGPIAIYDGLSGEILHRLAGHRMGTAQVAWRPDGRVLATIGQDGRALLWSLETGSILQELALGASWGECIVWNHEGSVLATAAAKRVRLWDAQGRQLIEYTDHASTVTDLQWKPGVDQVAAGAYGGAVIWASGQAEPVKRLAWQGSTLKLAWSPNGRVLAAGQQDSSIIFWDTRKAEPSMMWGYPTKIRELAWDRSSRFLATGGGETVVIWDFSGGGPEGSKPLMLAAHQAPLTSLAFQRRGALLASAAQDGALLLWLPGQQETPVSGFRGLSEVTHVVWSPNDQSMAAGDSAGAVLVFDLR